MLSTLSCLTLMKLVAKNCVKNDATIPAAVIRRGKNIAFLVVKSSYEVEPTTRAAQVASAKEPKRSAPMPAISPTLSPTLSAMTPGFEGSSSSRPYTTLPARSEPTSAALV